MLKWQPIGSEFSFPAACFRSKNDSLKGHVVGKFVSIKSYCDVEHQIESIRQETLEDTDSVSVQRGARDTILDRTLRFHFYHLIAVFEVGHPSAQQLVYTQEARHTRQYASILRIGISV